MKALRVIPGVVSADEPEVVITLSPEESLDLQQRAAEVERWTRDYPLPCLAEDKGSWPLGRRHWRSPELIDGAVQAELSAPDWRTHMNRLGEDPSSFKALVEDICERRKRLTLSADAGFPSLTVSEGLGRWLGFFPHCSLWDGAGVEPSEGLIDEANFPPFDIWIALLIREFKTRHLYGPVLVARVPEIIVPLVDPAVLVNPEECLVWLEPVD